MGKKTGISQTHRVSHFLDEVFGLFQSILDCMLNLFNMYYSIDFKPNATKGKTSMPHTVSLTYSFVFTVNTIVTIFEKSFQGCFQYPIVHPVEIIFGLPVGKTSL